MTARLRPSMITRYTVPVFVLALVAYLCLRSVSGAGRGQPYTLPRPASMATETAPHASGPEPRHGMDIGGWRSRRPSRQKPLGGGKTHDQRHAIGKLAANADDEFENLLAKRTYTIKEAAAAYRKRRSGRHPPPGFDVWHHFAVENNVVVVEEFWDQIYHDLQPFWGLPARRIQRDAADFEITINVRNGSASTRSDWFWTRIWLDMIKNLETMLPDMDIALNAMDEPRVTAPWEDIDRLRREADKSAKRAAKVSLHRVINTYQELPENNTSSAFADEDGVELNDGRGSTADLEFERTGSFWDLVRRGCPPSSAARLVAPMTDFRHDPKITDEYAQRHMYEGYVSNVTLARDICHQPDQQGLNGIFIEPLMFAETPRLFPLFGGSKLSVNNEILLPAPMYWSREERFHGPAKGELAWEKKQDRVVWRGVATGGHNRESNWRGFQRHRFVRLNNATALARNDVTARFAPWVSQWSDVAFVDLMCDDSLPAAVRNASCPYVRDHFEVRPGMALSEQFNNKFLPDIDGNSFSGRYLSFLSSGSLPIKAALWREWHDSRLVAWKHFVPMDMRFGEWFGIMDYFLRPENDALAEKIALDGQAWARQVLRREDMQAYVLRLLLEYARVADEQRDNMGWVGDLM